MRCSEGGADDLGERKTRKGEPAQECAMCQHIPTCPTSEAPDREAARVVSGHPEQGWSLLCNGVIMFEDTGELLPDRSTVRPHRGLTHASYADAAVLPAQRTMHVTAA
jgi:hypothetical protein